MTGSAFAFQPPEWIINSGNQTADASITTDAGYFYGFIIDSSGLTTSATYAIYDSGSTVTTTQILPALVYQSGVSKPDCVFLTEPIPYTSGIYVDVTTTGSVTPNFMILYRSR